MLPATYFQIVVANFYQLETGMWQIFTSWWKGALPTFLKCEVFHFLTAFEKRFI